MSKSKQKVVAATAVVAALIAGASDTSAGMPVIDIANVIQSTLNQINTYTARFQDIAEYTEEMARWKRTLEQYQNQLIQMQGIVMAFGLPPGQPVTKVQPDYMVAERCGGGISMSSLTKVFQINATGNIIEQQKQLCANIQRMENIKFNYTVDFVTKYAPQMQEALKKSEARRNSSNTQGNVAAADNDALRIGNTADANFQEWQANIQVYDSYIASMENNQRILARVAMKGKETVLGTMIQTGALKGALEVGN